MGFQIEDGGGRGRSAKVAEEGRLLVEAVTSTSKHHANHHDGTAYNLLFSATPSGAGDCFLYVKNTSDTDLVVEGFWLKLAADEYIDVKIGDSGTPAGGSAITPANLNSGSGKDASGTFQNGNDITGLSGGTTVIRVYHASSNGSVSYNFDQDIIIRKDGVLTMYVETGTTALAGFLVFNYHDAEN